VAKAREEWKKAHPALNPNRLVFIDETSTNTQLTHTRGRRQKGKRLVDYAPRGHWKTTTFVAGLRNNAITAPLVVDQPMNGVIFQAWLEQHLAPTLRESDNVIIDNLPAHKVPGVRAIIENAGASLLYLPPYSPDLNPIEMMFSKLKALLRKAKERTVDKLWDRIGAILGEFNSPECSNYFSHHGYG
jgi:transposase